MYSAHHVRTSRQFAHGGGKTGVRLLDGAAVLGVVLMESARLALHYLHGGGMVGWALAVGERQGMQCTLLTEGRGCLGALQALPAAGRPAR